MSRSSHITEKCPRSDLKNKEADYVQEKRML